MTDWPKHYEPDYGDLESGLLNRGLINVRVPTFRSGRSGYADVIVPLCRYGDHPVDPDDEYGIETRVCYTCRDEMARDAAGERRFEEQKERRYFGND